MWPSLFPVCKNAAGSRQSPININSTAAKYDNTLGKLVLSKYDTTNSNKMKLSNNGHSVTVSMGNNKFESMVTHKGTETSWPAQDVFRPILNVYGSKMHLLDRFLHV